MDKDIIGYIRNYLKRTKNTITILIIFMILNTGLIIVLPQILSKYIDKVEIESYLHLIGIVIIYIITVGVGIIVNIANTFISEKIGWDICDDIRSDLVVKCMEYDIQYHKINQDGKLIERIEGDVNILSHFFSSFFINIFGNLFLIIGIITIFFFKFMWLGIIFSIISIFIILMFLLSQNKISKLWANSREIESISIGEFSESSQAKEDIIGNNKKSFIIDKLNKVFKNNEKANVKASIYGNIPATIFYSMINIGEGVTLAVGIWLFYQNKISLGEVYSIISYVGYLNTPFLYLKYEFAEMPKIIAAIKRVGELLKNKESQIHYGMQILQKNKTEIDFKNVSFSYVPNNWVLNNVSFSIHTGEHILISGRTGSGKSTILQLLAKFYEPLQGAIKINKIDLKEYQRESYYKGISYIMQNIPILEDTIRNNIVRYSNKYSDNEIKEALDKVGLLDWLKLKENGLDTVINNNLISYDEAQLLGWTNILLDLPQIILVDEFDAIIKQNTIEKIDNLINTYLKNITIIFVSHQTRSDIKYDKIIYISNGKIINIKEGK